jgi:hypothetical protein
MTRRTFTLYLGLIFGLFSYPVFAETPPAPELALIQAPAEPAWIQRGHTGPAHTALEPLIGKWQVEVSIYGAMGRSPDAPPLVSHDVMTTRAWVADGHYIEDTTEGTIAAQPYWRRGWLGYSNIDRRYEWVTIAPFVPMMMYRSQPGTGAQNPIDLTGVFTDQGVVSEKTVGQLIKQRTVFKIENNDKHTSELYFTPPGGKEQLALRMVYTRIK